MTAQLIDGKAIAAELRSHIRDAVARFNKPPSLATVLVGDNPASALYVQNKLKACAEVGIKGHLVSLPVDVAASTLQSRMSALSNDPGITGILLQLPLPEGLNAQSFISLIAPEKDVDGLGAVNYGLLAAGQPAHVPCTPLGCLYLIKKVMPQLAGKHAVVLGRSRLVGRPMAELLLQANCTVTIAHSKTPDLPAVTRSADIVVAAVGQPALVKAGWIKPGAVVIDVGINRIGTRVCGDVDYDAVREVAGALTPVPGGVGPMTVAMLMGNTARAAYRQNNQPLPEELLA